MTDTNVEKMLNQLMSNSGDEIGSKLDKAISLVEGITLRNRMKNTTVTQMIFTLEENFNASIDAVHKQCLEAIHAESDNGGSAVVMGGKAGGQPQIRRRSTLKVLFFSVTSDSHICCLYLCFCQIIITIFLKQFYRLSSAKS
jgi:hypothetical protein